MTWPNAPHGCLIIGLVALAVGRLAIGQTSSLPPATQPFLPIILSGVSNAHRVTDRVYSGAQPESEATFKDLAALGIKTIISVDGAAPDVATAKKYGLRYVHLPIGYDDVGKDEGLALAKAMAELPGPVYVHCHHGKHRSAAAVAVACVINGSLAPARAEEVLRTFGTGINYEGLWRSARGARAIEPSELRAVQVSYVEKAKVPPIAEAMVHIDERTEHLKAIQLAGWKAPANHPDLNPPHEALQLQEMLVELGRSEASQAKPADFAQMMAASASAVGSLRTALMAQPVDPVTADSAMKAITASCTACHKVYRD